MQIECSNLFPNGCDSTVCEPYDYKKTVAIPNILQTNAATPFQTNLLDIETCAVIMACGQEAILGHVIRRHVIQCHLVLGHVTQLQAILVNVILLHVIRYHVILRHVIQHHVILGHVIQRHVILGHVIQ